MIKYIILMVFLFIGCTHKSELKYESGIVMETVYSPPFSASGTSVGFSGENVSIGVHSTNKEEEYFIVFKCEHNKVFSVESKELYNKLVKGDTVKISFYEVLDSDNNIKDFDFVNVERISK